MRFFILANGKATRWNNYMNVDKQMLVIDNEPILHRTVRLLKENNQDDIYIIGKYEVNGAKNYIPQTDSIIGKYDCTKELWECDEFVLLYGDCYYTEAIIKDICERTTKKKWLHWTCNRPNNITGKVYPEGYAHKVYDVKWWKEKCIEYHKLLNEAKIEHKSDWVFLRFLLNIDLYNHQPELMKEFEVDWEDETDDFDYPIDYDNWIKNCRGKKYKLSIIIPTYNLEKYIRECLNSLLFQLNNECQLIVVDDHSTDNTVSIVYDLINGRDNCKFMINYENKGVSYSRNMGLKVAKGEHIAFVDGDDLVKVHYIKYLFEAMQQNADCYKMSWENINGEQYYAYSLPYWNCSVWSRLFKRDKITRFFDESLKKAEDIQFLLDNVTDNMSIGYIEKSIYIYRNGREGSLTNGG